MKTLHVGRPNIPDRDLLHSCLDDILDRNWLTNDGPYVQRFESEIAARLGVKHCIAVCNGTIGLMLVIKALELSGEVIVPSFTFIATAHALEWMGIKPVFCDIDATWCLDPDWFVHHLSGHTTGIIGVHLFGRPCNTKAIGIFARDYGVKVIYDAAHAFMCSHNQRMIGSFGDAEVFSFHATKFVNSFEGGAITTNDGALADKLRLYRNFGFEGYDHVVSTGINAKMSEIHAAMGIASLKALPLVMERNGHNYYAYAELLEGIPGITLRSYPQYELNNYQYVVLEVESGRDELLQTLHDENILARRYFYPGCHASAPYRSSDMMLPVTLRASARVLCLPTGLGVTRKDIERIANGLRNSR